MDLFTVHLVCGWHRATRNNRVKILHFVGKEKCRSTAELTVSYDLKTFAWACNCQLYIEELKMATAVFKYIKIRILNIKSFESNRKKKVLSRKGNQFEHKQRNDWRCTISLKCCLKWFLKTVIFIEVSFCRTLNF